MILTAPLFPILDQKLIELLRSLTADEWNKKTIAGTWTVKDVASHLLDTAIRTLSMGRDRHVLLPDREINSYQSLVGYLNHLNAEWVAATQRLSPTLLTELLDITGKQYSDYIATLNMDIDAPIPVAWAGETVSKNWFHIARDYTERWHHQQQIRDAVNKPGIMTAQLFYPVMNTFMHGLPYTYRNITAENNTMIKITICTAIGGDWFLKRQSAGWELGKSTPDAIASALVIPPDIAWKLFTKGLKPEAALPYITITGDRALTLPALNLVAVMA
ncbi:maleylpyruvate isomerase N-terminal domain-containing protein [Mucilaginibacter paludis]|uniref:Mycothiol-dependent maleylpyruvate isomerase metal-binding domain-containing protein n=1 Tax=Mucilaginibacter paludis DSM 18603 TaxID=714943 RepID=H1Y494_9SPHI|nr:maleylpyruvate isomerase N-terminal domain-containing protein [Mucilaginibacter paludis]EHQ25728.1 hypothetical protein Mucpa_1570 [Mucilaginibacter paludis DSM 18603]